MSVSSTIGRSRLAAVVAITALGLVAALQAQATNPTASGADPAVAEVATGLVVHEFGFIWETGISENEVSVQDLLGDLPSHVRHEAKETPLEAGGNDPFAGEFPGGGGIPVTANVPSIPSLTTADPFVFFYSEEARTVDVAVEFTDGRPIAWFPRVDEYHLQKLVWNDVSITKEKPRTRNFKPFRDEGDKSKWRGMEQARAIQNACVLECGTQIEKYLFYEAAVSYPTALLYEAVGDDGRARSFTLANTQAYSFLDLYVIPAGADRIKGVAYVSELRPGEILEVALDAYGREDGSGGRVQWIEASDLSAHLSARAALLGLFEDEASLCASSVLDAGFMKSKGRKAIYRLPREEYDRIYPLTITPAPEATVRVGMVLVPELRNRSISHFVDVAMTGKPSERARARGALSDMSAQSLPRLEELLPRVRGKTRKHLERAVEVVRAKSASDKNP